MKSATLEVSLDAAAQQWAAIQEALPVPVLTAPNISETNRTVVHILALQDIVRYGRVIVGLDVPPHILVAESCFCANDDTLGKLQFAIAQARRDRPQIPSCARCLRTCASITRLPIDAIRKAAL